MRKCVDLGAHILSSDADSNVSDELQKDFDAFVVE